jgi:hypothetical protein
MEKRKGRLIDQLPITDVFRRAAARRERDVERAIEKRPLSGDWNRFWEAARDSLAGVPGLKQHLGRRGLETLMRGSVSTAPAQAALRAALWHLVEHSVSDDNQNDLLRAISLKAKIAARRVISAKIVIDVESCAKIERQTLLDATLHLRELHHEIEALGRQERVGRYPRNPTQEDKARIRWARNEFRDWRARHPKRPASEGHLRIFNHAKKAGFKGWSTVGACRSWMNRKRIVV